MCLTYYGATLDQEPINQKNNMTAGITLARTAERISISKVNKVEQLEVIQVRFTIDIRVSDVRF